MGAGTSRSRPCWWLEGRSCPYAYLHFDLKMALRRRSHRNSGPPTTAVSAPTGISSGAAAQRSAASHAARRDPPSKNEQKGAQMRLLQNSVLQEPYSGFRIQNEQPQNRFQASALQNSDYWILTAVDSLSLHLSLANSPDERVRLAAAELLEQMAW
jgi:hypothetical protein